MLRVADVALGTGSILIDRLAVTTLIRRMGIEALYRRPDTAKPMPGHKLHPYRNFGNSWQPHPSHRISA